MKEKGVRLKTANLAPAKSQVPNSQYPFLLAAT